MSTDSIPLHLPPYQTFIEGIASLALPISGSELHGVMCGYLCAGATKKGETYLRALMGTKQDDAAKRIAILALFGVYTVSQQQITNLNFEFHLMLPDEQTPLSDRAQAFTEWCEGFTQGMTMAGIRDDQLEEDEAKEAMQHLAEFAELDYEGLQAGEEDERALMEVYEYARMAVLHIYSDLQSSQPEDTTSDRAH